MASYPALDVVGLDVELLLALVDDFSPTAAQEHAAGVAVFFPDAAQRDAAHDALRRERPDLPIASRDVDDEDWAKRSQQNLSPVTVGRLTIHPTPLDQSPLSHLQSAVSNLQSAVSNLQSAVSNLHSGLHLVIPPSMGFGTGHHATTRLCLQALQSMDLTDRVVLDIGTGSGVLAMAARLFGAGDAVGIDVDADAIQCANENLALNPSVKSVRFETADLRAWLVRARREGADVVTANLTGALLERSANLLVDALRPGGHLIVSGLMRSERADVGRAFAIRTKTLADSSEGEWAAIVFERLH